MANSVDPDQTAPIGAVCSGSTLFASILNLSAMLGNYLQQTTSADDNFRCFFFLGPVRYKVKCLFIIVSPLLKGQSFVTYETPQLATFTSQIPSFCQAPGRLEIGNHYV